MCIGRTITTQSVDPELSPKKKPSWFSRARRRIVETLRGEESETAIMSRQATSLSTIRSGHGSDINEYMGDTSGPFNERWLALMQSRARTEGRRTGGSIGVGLGTICLIPFGPIAMCICGLGAFLIGYLLGLLFDLHRARTRESVAEKQLKRLTYLVRFATDQIDRRLFIHSSESDTDYCLALLESVILEFKPFVEVAHLSPILQKKLNLFHFFLRHQSVRDCLWIYVNGFLSKWTTSLTVPEFTRTCGDILSTLVMLERKLGLVEPESRLAVIIKVEEFLNDPKVKAFNSHQQHQGEAVKKSLEAVLVRDHYYKIPSSPRRRRLSSADVYSARSFRIAPSGSPQATAGSDDDDDLLFEDTYEDALIGSRETSPATVRRAGVTPRTSRSFFKSFQDFMDFDVELKHQMPISPTECRFLYEKEAEPLTANGWELAVDRKLIKVLKFVPPDSSRADTGTSVLVRAYAVLPMTRIETCFYNIYDPKKRQSWDSNFAEISVIPTPDSEILYCVLQSPFGVTPRDFLQYRRANRELGEDGSSVLIIIMRSAAHAEKPPIPGYIRAESYISGYVMRQRGKDCHLFIMSQTDVKGLIPKWIVNMMAAKAPAQWVDNLVKSCNNCVKDFSNDVSKMNDFLSEYVEEKLGGTAPPTV